MPFNNPPKSFRPSVAVECAVVTTRRIISTIDEANSRGIGRFAPQRSRIHASAVKLLRKDPIPSPLANEPVAENVTCRVSFRGENETGAGNLSLTSQLRIYIYICRNTYIYMYI